MTVCMRSGWHNETLRLAQGALLTGLALGCAKSQDAQKASGGSAADRMNDAKDSAANTSPPDANSESDANIVATRSDPDASVDASANPTQGCQVRKGDGETLIIDDFETAGDFIRVQADRGGEWVFYDDGSGGEQQVTRPNDGSGVLRVESSGFSIWGSGFGTLLSPDSSASSVCPYDASNYDGIAFRARGEGRVRVRLAMPENMPVADGGTCTKPDQQCYDWPGAWVQLSPQWASYSLPFCVLQPENWSGEALTLDASKLAGLHFQLSGEADMFIDDLAFLPATSAVSDQATTDLQTGSHTENDACDLPCPFDTAPTWPLAEDESWLPLSDELTLNTFEQESTRCGAITRRYISYAPKALGPASSAPIVVALHGSGANAESFQELMTHGHLDQLAARDGFIAVYANAAPGAYSQADLPNSGAWRQGPFDDGEVDDLDYLEQVIEDLVERGLIAGDNPVCLIGHSNGGGMILDAVRARPDRYAAIAALMAFDGATPKPPPSLDAQALRRVFFAYAPGDPGLPVNYVQEVLSKQPAAWARALGISEIEISAPRVTAIDDVSVEGEGYDGDAAAALATRDSRATQLDMSDPSGSARLRVLVLENGGHFLPSPTQDSEDWILQRWGFRNQDVDTSDVVWEFFREALTNAEAVE